MRLFGLVSSTTGRGNRGNWAHQRLSMPGASKNRMDAWKSCGRPIYPNEQGPPHSDAAQDSAVVRIDSKRAESRPVDCTGAEIAAANGGRCSVDIHLYPYAAAGSEPPRDGRCDNMEGLGGETGSVRQQLCFPKRPLTLLLDSPSIVRHWQGSGQDQQSTLAEFPRRVCLPALVQSHRARQ
jgi:hypothetical protein